MNNFIKALAIVLVLWLPFSVGDVAAIGISLWSILFGSPTEQQGYGKNVLRCMDKTLAAVLGFSGYYTLSAELGAGSTSSFGYKYEWIRNLLDKIQPGHCEGAAKNEGLLKE